MMEDLSGQSFGGYDLLERVDDNNIILTYRARQVSLGREVAFHMVREDKASRTTWEAAMVKGAEIASTLEHPNIVPIIDLGHHDARPFVVLRHMQGGTLKAALADRRFQLNEAASIITQIASALDYVHSHDLYHGDPATVNVIFDAIGNAYIADFYVAGLLEISDTMQPIGVPAFMAPERGLGHRPDALTDQYALAGVAYAVLTGRVPQFEAAGGRRRLIAPQTHRAEVPSAINAVLERALSVKAGERYPTVREFARDYARVLRSASQHIFISYSRHDTDYARQLREALTERSLPVWIDDQIEHGDQWFNQINDAIQASVAVVVLMSPAAEQSEWVQKEVLLAKRYQKPIFPVLVSGQEFPLLIDLQFADARDGDLPDLDFYRRLSRTFHGD